MKEEDKQLNQQKIKVLYQAIRKEKTLQVDGTVREWNEIRV